MSFIIVHNQTEQQLLDLCKTLFRITEEPFVVNQHSFYLSLSIGIAVYPFGGINTTTLLQHADIAMYSKGKKVTMLFVCMTRHYLKK